MNSRMVLAAKTEGNESNTDQGKRRVAEEGKSMMQYEPSD